ncbi:MAG: V-type ATP synthase subunit E family protein [Acidilobaceae archaeon]
MSRFIGDSEKLAREAVKDDVERSMKLLLEAYSTSMRLLEEAYGRSLGEAEKRLREEYSNLEEQLKSLRSRLEFDLRSRVIERRNTLVDEVIREAIARIKSMKGEDWYKSFLERVFDLIGVEARSIGSLVVRVSREDISLAKSLSEKYSGLIEVSDEPVDIIGGVLVESKNGVVKLDFSIDLIISRNDARLRNIALKALLG